MFARGVSGGVACAAILALSLAGACSAPVENIGVDHSADTAGEGFCRTRTCSPPSDYPRDGLCEPPGWAQSATCAGSASDAPEWWRTACVGYDLNESASKNVSYAQFSDSVRGAFAAWTQTTCPAATGSGGHPSIDVRDLGAVPCAHAAYDKTGGPNQNVIVFHDDAWPYEAADRKRSGLAKSPTIALTIVTADVETGEIYDADIELNSADYTIVPLTAGVPNTNDAFDLQAVLTHEIGHFLGLAHSPRPDAVMFSSGDSDNGTAKRSLTAVDQLAICTVYPEGGTRSVSTLADSSGSVSEGACDPTPHHGFTPNCP